MDGFDWNSRGTDSLTVTTRGLATQTTFTWLVKGKPVAVKRARVC